MNQWIKLSALLITSLFAIPALAAPTIGEPAPAIDAVDTNGEKVTLDALKGKIVVLEWTNAKCPFVVKHYSSDNMQQLQKQAAKDGVVWITVNSSSEGKQGFVTAEEANAIVTEKGAAPAHVILDPAGAIGHAYDAKTTPNMYVINAEGTLVYMGAIDSKATADKADIADATNYVSEAITALKAATPITNAQTKPYGCGVKY